MENQLFELARKRRSIRQYGNKRIDDDVIAEIMKVALTAPTSFGHHAVEFVVVREAEMIRKVGACKNFVAIVKTSDKRASEFWIEDGAIASAYLLLAIEQYDLGACWVHIRNRKGKLKSSDEEIRQLLNIPDGYTVLNLVALGEKGEKKAPYTEKDLKFGNIHMEKF